VITGGRRGIAALALVAIVIALAGCSSGARGESHLPVQTSRVKVLANPPLPGHLPFNASHYLIGSPDRLVVARGTRQRTSSLDQAPLAVAAYDFRRTRWSRLPDAPTFPVALPEGLVAVDIPCARRDRSKMDCQVRLSTLRWDDRAWEHQQVTKRAVTVDIEIGDIDWGVQPLGVRNRWAFFRVYRYRDQRILKVSVDGRVRTLPKAPVPGTPMFHDDVICVSPGGLDTVARQIAVAGNPPGSGTGPVTFGPVHHLDDRIARPRWDMVPDTDPLTVPGPGEFECGGRGPVFMSPPTTIAWTHDRLVTVAREGTPAPPRHAGLSKTTAPLADGGFAFRDDRSVHRLRDGHWQEWPILTKPGDDQLFELTTVGDLIVYQVLIYNTDRTELRVIP
jgi:hypothetical protein